MLSTLPLSQQSSATLNPAYNRSLSTFERIVRGKEICAELIKLNKEPATRQIRESLGAHGQLFLGSDLCLTRKGFVLSTPYQEAGFSSMEDRDDIIPLSGFCANPLMRYESVAIREINPTLIRAKLQKYQIGMLAIADDSPQAVILPSITEKSNSIATMTYNGGPGFEYCKINYAGQDWRWQYPKLEETFSRIGSRQLIDRLNKEGIVGLHNPDWFTNVPLGNTKVLRYSDIKGVEEGLDPRFQKHNSLIVLHSLNDNPTNKKATDPFQQAMTLAPVFYIKELYSYQSLGVYKVEVDQKQGLFRFSNRLKGLYLETKDESVARTEVERLCRSFYVMEKEIPALKHGKEQVEIRVLIDHDYKVKGHYMKVKTGLRALIYGKNSASSLRTALKGLVGKEEAKKLSAEAMQGLINSVEDLKEIYPLASPSRTSDELAALDFIPSYQNGKIRWFLLESAVPDGFHTGIGIKGLRLTSPAMFRVCIKRGNTTTV